MWVFKKLKNKQPDGKRQLGRQRLRWEDNINVGLQEVEKINNLR
jgi:hypothetical protein